MGVPVPTALVAIVLTGRVFMKMLSAAILLLMGVKRVILRLVLVLTVPITMLFIEEEPLVPAVVTVMADPADLPRSSVKPIIGTVKVNIIRYGAQVSMAALAALLLKMALVVLVSLMVFTVHGKNHPVMPPALPVQKVAESGGVLTMAVLKPAPVVHVVRKVQFGHAKILVIVRV